MSEASTNLGSPGKTVFTNEVWRPKKGWARKQASKSHKRRPQSVTKQTEPMGNNLFDPFESWWALRWFPQQWDSDKAKLYASFAWEAGRDSAQSTIDALKQEIARLKNPV